MRLGGNNDSNNNNYLIIPDIEINELMVVLTRKSKTNPRKKEESEGSEKVTQ